MTFRSLFFLLAAAILQHPAGADQSTSSPGSASPFMAENGAVATSSDTSQNFELVGAIATTRHTLVGIINRNTHKSLWILVGKSSEGVEVISYDQRQDRAVIKINGLLETLTMHAASATGSVAVASAPITSSAPAAATGPQAQQEQEARMLVSDLMDISIQQRKAYEESQRQAAASNQK